MRKGVVYTVAIAAALVCAPSTPAQMAGSHAPERYEKRTKGANIDDFVKNLNSDEPNKRLEAVKSLGASNEPKAIDYLLQAVGDSDVRVRAKAISVLGQLRATEATPVLIQYLFLRTTDPQMKNLILASLGQIGDARAAKPIVDFLHRDLDEATRGTAIFALGEIGSSDASQTLESMAKTEKNSTLKRLTTEALAKVEQRQAVRSAEAKEPSELFLDHDRPPAR